jgi:homoserine O-acetyltransferase
VTTPTRPRLDNPHLVAPARQLVLDAPLGLDCGQTLPRATVNFETYGRLTDRGDNAILVCHSLTHRAHAAGRHGPADGGRGWWHGAIGPGQLLDTDKYFVICTDALAAGGTTGPASVDPATGRPYGMRFPVVTVRDMVNLQSRFIRRLGLDRLHAVIGGCLGGQQALEWAICYPEMVRNAVVITTTPATSAHTIAIFAVMRHLIRADPQWRDGDYYGTSFPRDGLNAAVAAAVPLWMSREAMEQRFGRPAGPYSYTLDAEFAVESFIDSLVARARHELDPNGLMYLMRAVEYFDLAHEYGGLEQALAPVSARVMFVSYARDWRYPAAETEHMHRVLAAAGAGLGPGVPAHRRRDGRLHHGRARAARRAEDPGRRPAHRVRRVAARAERQRRVPERGGPAARRSGVRHLLGGAGHRRARGRAHGGRPRGDDRLRGRLRRRGRPP